MNVKEAGELTQRFAKKYMDPPHVHMVTVLRQEEELVLFVQGETLSRLSLLPSEFEGMKVVTEVGPQGRVL